MKIIGIKDYQQQEINAAELMQLATGYHNSRYSMRVAGIWDSVNSRILIGLDDDANGSEKSGGPSGTPLVTHINKLFPKLTLNPLQVSVVKKDEALLWQA